MTPMVDVTFLLLIFFMVTASFTMQKALIVPTPKEKEQPSVQTIDDLEEDPHYIIVRIDQYNGFHVETPGSDNEAPSEHDLMLELRRARRTPIDGVVPSKLLIMADIDSLHEKAVAAIDIGMEVGMEQVQMTTVEEEE